MNRDPEVRQLKVWFEVHPNIEQQVQSAVHLARLLNTKLVARFLQNRALIAAAELPIVTEVLLWSGAEKATSSEQFAKASRTQEKRAAALLAKAAKQSKISYSFTTCQRRALPKKPSQRTRAAYWVAGHWGENATLAKPICALDDASTAGKQCTALATAAAARMGTPLLVLRINPSGAETENHTTSDPTISQNHHDTVDFASLAEAWHWLDTHASIPCSAVFMPLAMHERIKKTNAFQSARFPVLLV